MIYVTEAKLEHAAMLAPKLGEIDKYEINCVEPNVPIQDILEGTIGLHNESYSIMKDDEVISMFGIRKVAPREGVIWMLNCEGFFDNKFTIRFLRETKQYIQKQMESYRVLYNFVAVRNKPSIEWLTWLGFTVVTVPVPRSNEPFYFFFIGKD